MQRQIKREKQRTRHPEELKRKIAKSYLSGEASYAVLAEENGLKSKNVVKEFVKWYRKILSKEPANSQQMQEDSKGPLSTDVEDLQAQVKLLQKRLSRSELKVEALETMIDIAEEELKVPIRKKSGSKQSKE